MSRQLLNISKYEDYTTSLGNLCQRLVTLTVKTCFLMFRWNLQFVPIASGPVTSKHLKEPGFVSFEHSLQVYIYIDKILSEPSPLQPGVPDRCSSPLIILLLSLLLHHIYKHIYINIYIYCTQEPRTGHRNTGGAESALYSII